MAHYEHGNIHIKSIPHIHFMHCYWRAQLFKVSPLSKCIRLTGQVKTTLIVLLILNLHRLIEKDDNSVYTLSCQIRFLISLTYMLSIFLSYMLMLIVMTFNGGLFIVTVLGLTCGYLIFGFIRKGSYTRIYNPEGDKCCTEVDGWNYIVIKFI